MWRDDFFFHGTYYPLRCMKWFSWGAQTHTAQGSQTVKWVNKIRKLMERRSNWVFKQCVTIDCHRGKCGQIKPLNSCYLLKCSSYLLPGTIVIVVKIDHANLMCNWQCKWHLSLLLYRKGPVNESKYAPVNWDKYSFKISEYVVQFKSLLW